MKRELFRRTPWNRVASVLLIAGLVVAAAPTVVTAPADAGSQSPPGGLWLPASEASEADGPVIQPGAPTRTCTLGFLFRSPTNGSWYATTAGHCIFDDVVRHQDGGLIGPVVATQTDGDDDWALVRVVDEAVARVRAEVVHWTGPSGPPVPHDIRTNDVVCHYGWPDVMKFVEDLRHRCGMLQAYRHMDGVTGFVFRGRLNFGDSGSPVLHYRTGQAMGMVLAGWPGYNGVAIDVCSLLERFADHGYNLTLATAAYNPPPQDLTLPAPTVDPQITASPTPLRCL